MPSTFQGEMGTKLEKETTGQAGQDRGEYSSSERIHGLPEEQQATPDPFISPTLSPSQVAQYTSPSHSSGMSVGHLAFPGQLFPMERQE